MTERILLHAGVADSRMYRDQLDALAPAHAFDLPGFGRTPPGGVGIRDFVRERLPDKPVTLIGTSLGAVIALELALETPERVAALVLAGPGLDGHEWSAEMRAFGEEEEAALERGDLDAAVEANLKMWLADDVDSEVRTLVADMQRTAFVLQKDHEFRMQRLDPPASTRLGDVRVPTLVLTGEEDVRDIQEIADQLAAEIPDSERASIPGAAHLPSLERPDEFNRIVLDFLRRHGA